MNNDPPSRDVRLDDILDLSPLNVPVKIRQLLDTVSADPFCFVYSEN
jgi:hypothetical protein